MRRPFFSLRPLARFSAPVLGVLLLASVVLGALHHHTDGLDHRECAVCTVSHAPGLPTVGVAAPSAPLTFERIIATSAPTPRPAAPSVVSCRAPPSA